MPLYNEDQWFRFKDAHTDKGSFGVRVAPEGSVAVIAKVLPRRINCYSLTFWPSGVEGTCSEAEILANAEPLPIDHPDVPSTNAWILADAVVEIYQSQAFWNKAGQDLWNKKAGMMNVLSHLATHLRTEAKGSAIEKMVNSIFGKEDGQAIFVKTAQLDALSAAVGRGDRFTPTDNPQDGFVEKLFPTPVTVAKPRPTPAP